LLFLAEASSKGRRAVAMRLLSKFFGEAISRDDAVIASYVGALQPLSPLNVFILPSILLEPIRKRNWALIAMLFAIGILTTVPLAAARIVGSVLILALVLLSHKFSPAEVFARAFILSIATYLASFGSAGNVMSFVFDLQQWVSKGGNDVLALYVACITVAEVSDVSKVAGLRLLKKLENPSIAAGMLFVAFLVFAAVLLAVGMEALANRLAELAYIALVIAVAHQVYELKRVREREQGRE